MTQILPDIFAIEVPSMAFGFMINNYGDESELMYMVDLEEITDLPEHKHDETLITKKLGSGSYEILFTTNEYAGYLNQPIKSLQSLLRSHNLTGKNYLLIKKQP